MKFDSVRVFFCMLSLILLAGGSTVRASESPLYRFALEHGRPLEAELFEVRFGNLSAAEEQLRQRIVSDFAESAHTNIMFTQVDGNSDLERSTLPLGITNSWPPILGSQSLGLWYVLKSASGRTLYSGTGQGSDLANLFDSPSRRQLAQVLYSGKQVGLIWVTGSSTEAIDPSAVCQQIKAASAASSKCPDIDLQIISPTDPAEAWLCQQLRMELPAPSQEDAALAALVYGRGRVLRVVEVDGFVARTLGDDFRKLTATYTGSSDNLPGFDLIMDKDWSAVLSPQTPDSPRLVAAKPELPDATVVATTASLTRRPPWKPGFERGLTAMVVTSLMMLFWLMFVVIRSR